MVGNLRLFKLIDKIFNFIFITNKYKLFWKISGTDFSEIFGERPPTIRIGSATTTNTENPEGMYQINLKEHASIPEVLEYVDETKPKNVIIDNSVRVDNPENASYLANKVRKVCDNVILSPEKHPNVNWQ